MSLAFVGNVSAATNYWLDSSDLAFIHSANQANEKQARFGKTYDADLQCETRLYLSIERPVRMKESEEPRSSEMHIKVDDLPSRSLKTLAVNDYVKSNETHLVDFFDDKKLHKEMLNGWKMYVRYRNTYGDGFSPTLIFNLKNYRTATGNAERHCMKVAEEQRLSGEVW